MTEFISEVFSTIFGDNVILATILISVVPMIELKGAIPFAMSTDFWGSVALSANKALLFSLIGSCLIVPILALIYIPVINALKKVRLFRYIALKIERKVNRSKNRIERRALKTSALHEENSQTLNVSAKEQNLQNSGNSTKAEEQNLSALTESSKSDQKNNSKNGEVHKNSSTSETEKSKPKTKYNKAFFIKLISVFLFVCVPLPLTGVWTGTCVAVVLGLGLGWTCLSVISGNIVAGVLVMFVSSIPGFDSSYIVYAVVAFILIMVLVWVIKSLVNKKKHKQHNIQ